MVTRPLAAANGPAQVLARVDAAWRKDLSFVPPPVASPKGRVVVSMLGGPRGSYGQLKLVQIANQRTVSVALGGRLMEAKFNQTGSQLSVVREVPEENSNRIRAPAPRSRCFDAGATCVRRCFGRTLGDVFGREVGDVAASRPSRFVRSCDVDC